MFLITSITTLRERRTGTLERLLSMPLGKGDLILGYTLAFGLLAVALADGLLGTSLGLLASAFARTEFQVVQFMPALVFPQVILGGVFIPRDQMPDVLYAISDWLPLSHAIDALNAVARDSEDASWVGARLLIIGGFAVAAVVLGAITLRRRSP
jgi:ABC-2 type transport system ATP-binding protein/ABC-2 type transport system permease protein